MHIFGQSQKSLKSMAALQSCE